MERPSPENGMERSSSPPTSPPSSAAPPSEDEFTTMLLRRVAHSLGVDYTPASSSGYRAAYSGSRKQFSEAAVGLRAQKGSKKEWEAHSPAVVIPPVSGAQAYATEEVQKMIEVRKKALGAGHPSVAHLRVALAERYALDRKPSQAQKEFNLALTDLESHYGENSVDLLETITKLGNFYASIGKFIEARDVLHRAVSIVDSHSGVGSQSALMRDAEPQKSVTEEESKTLRSLIMSLKSEGDDSLHHAVANRLLNDLAGAHRQSTKAVETRECEVQTDAEVRPNDVTCNIDEQLATDAQQQARGTRLRTAADLRSLVSYIGDPEAKRVMEETRRALNAVKASVEFYSSAENQGDQPSMLSPRSIGAQQRAKDLQRTVELVRQKMSSEQITTETHDFSPLNATEREVARMLLSAQKAQWSHQQ